MSNNDVDLGCMIYVDSNPDCDLLAAVLSQHLGAALEAKHIISAGSVRLNVRGNEDFNPFQRADFPGGFNFFRCYIEVDQSDATTLTEEVQLIGTILEYCWAHDLPAVAACEFEDRLPRSGGYNSHQIPWPDPAPTA